MGDVLVGGFDLMGYLRLCVEWKVGGVGGGGGRWEMCRKLKRGFLEGWMIDGTIWCPSMWT